MTEARNSMSLHRVLLLAVAAVVCFSLGALTGNFAGDPPRPIQLSASPVSPSNDGVDRNTRNTEPNGVGSVVPLTTPPAAVKPSALKGGKKSSPWWERKEDADAATSRRKPLRHPSTLPGHVSVSAGTRGGDTGDTARPFEQCVKHLKHNRRWFHIMRVSGPECSVEQVTVDALRPLLRHLDAHDRRGGLPTIVVDIGANDGVDSRTWFRAFGRPADDGLRAAAIDPKSTGGNYSLDAPRTAHANTGGAGDDVSAPLHVLLFEPQPRYRRGLVSECLHGALLTPSLRSCFVVTAAIGPPAMHGTEATVVGSGEQVTLLMPTARPSQPLRPAAPDTKVEDAAGALGKLRAKGVGTAAVVDLSEALRDVASISVLPSPSTNGNSPTAGKGKGTALSPWPKLRDHFTDAVVVGGHTVAPRHSDGHRVARPPESVRGRIRLLKIDCEGADATIIHSSEALFRDGAVDVVIFEVHKNARLFPATVPDAVALLRRHSYRVFLLAASVPDVDPLMLQLHEVTAALARMVPPSLESIVAFSPFAIAASAAFRDGTAAFSAFPGALRPSQPAPCALSLTLIPCPLCTPFERVNPGYECW